MNSKILQTVTITLLLGLGQVAEAKTRLILPPPPPAADGTISSVWEQLPHFFENGTKLQVINHEAVDEYIRLETADKSKTNDTDEDDFKKAENLLKSGWKDYKNLKLPRAIEKLEKAKLIFRRLVHQVAATQKLLTSHLHLGIAYIAKGEATRGEKEIREMIIRDPARATRQLKSQYYSPKIIETYDRLRKNIITEESAKVVLAVEPAEAKIWFDGQLVKASLISKVPEGEHFVVAKAPGYMDYFSAKYVIAGENNLNIDMEKIAGLDVTEFFATTRNSYQIPQQTAKYVDDMTIKLHGDLLFFYKIYSDPDGQTVALEGQLYDQRSQEISTIETVNISGAIPVDLKSAQQLVDRLLAQVDNKGFVVAQKSTGPQTTGVAPSTVLGSPTGQDPLIQQNLAATKQKIGKAKPWYKEWWFYTAVGGAAVVVGSVLLFTDIAKSDATTSNFQVPNPTAN